MLPHQDSSWGSKVRPTCVYVVRADFVLVLHILVSAFDTIGYMATWPLYSSFSLVVCL